ncbi:MAG: outer membrane beta-barrel domain-containing protein [Deltaproteobacteria bacterium]|nr:outer membrane beta-barrel domain-containing protein [Deltaproteobacteria bacterium]
MKRFLFLCALASAPLVSPAAFAADADKKDDQKSDGEGESSRDDRMGDRSRRLTDRIKSVQRKAFIKRGRHELSVNGGLSLNDAFYQQFTVGAGYAYHIVDALALEASFKYFMPPLATDPRILRVEDPTSRVLIYSPQLTISAEAQFSPIYGKVSLMAEAVVHFDLYIAAGGGVLMTEQRRAGDGSEWRGLGTVAIGARIMLTAWLTLRFEFRDNLYQDPRTASSVRPNESPVQNLLMFNFGLSFFLPPSFDYKGE